MNFTRIFLIPALALATVLAAGCASVPTARAPIPAPNVAAPQIPKHELNFADFGNGDGKTLNTEAFEKALATLAAKGGGKLIVPPGIWLTGPIQLRSRIELHVERGALIQFIGDYRHYPLVVVDIRGEKEVHSTSPIHGQDLEDVAITGEGIIDGGGDAWRMIKKSKVTENFWNDLVKSGGVLNAKGDVWWPSQATMDGDALVKRLVAAGNLNLADYEPAHSYLRPKMLRLISVKRLAIQDVTFQNPPNWTVNPVLCEDVSIINMRVFNSRAAQNSDALDLESCRRAIIRGCVFDTGDDGICIKSGKDAVGRRIGVPTEDVLVENCVVYDAHGGFTIGSEMSGGVRNIRVNNCLFRGTDIGLRFKSTRGRGGVVENIHISNIYMQNIKDDAINFNLYYGGKESGEATVPAVTEETPAFRNIHMENIVCRGADHAVVLQGLPEMPLQNITLKNADFGTKFGVNVTDAEAVRFQNVRLENQSGEKLKTLRIKNSQLDLLP